MRLLGDHGRRRLQGPVRFGQDVILKFEQRGDVASPVPLPSFTVSACFRVPGPGAGPFTDRAAVDVATVLRAMLLTPQEPQSCRRQRCGEPIRDRSRRRNVCWPTRRLGS